MRSETYADPAMMATLGDIDISKYVACGIVVIDPRNGTILASFRTAAASIPRLHVSQPP